MTRPIIGYLTEFSPVFAVPGLTQSYRAGGGQLEAEPDRSEEIVASARQQGLEEGRRLSEADHAERLQRLEQQHAAAIDAARAQWADSEGSTLANRLRDGFATLESMLADSLSGVIQPFLDAAVRVKTTAELRQALSELLAGTQGALIEVKGPADIVDALRSSVGHHPGVVLTPSDGPEVVLEAAETTIRSQMQAWGARLQNAMGIAA